MGLRRIGRRPSAFLLIIATSFAFAGCTAQRVPPVSPAPPGLTEQALPAEDADMSGPFRLTLTLDRTVWSDSEQMQGRAELARVEGDVAQISGSGSGIGFAYTEVGGERYIEALWTSDCDPRVLRAGQPMVDEELKSGGSGWPDEFAHAFFSNAGVRLPAGLWTITASFAFAEGSDCSGTEHGLSDRATART